MRLKLMTMAVILALSSAAVMSQNQQGAKGPGQQAKLAVNLVRVVNTAEMAYRTQSPGSFADWADLAKSPGFAKAVDHFSHASPRLKDIRLENPVDVTPGWHLRLITSLDRKSYVIVLLNKSDRCSGFLSDEGGVIRRVAAMGCSPSDLQATASR